VIPGIRALGLVFLEEGLSFQFRKENARTPRFVFLFFFSSFFAFALSVPRTEGKGNPFQNICSCCKIHISPGAIAPSPLECVSRRQRWFLCPSIRRTQKNRSALSLSPAKVSNSGKGKERETYKETKKEKNSRAWGSNGLWCVYRSCVGCRY
jgi:hypothetical protein